MKVKFLLFFFSIFYSFNIQIYGQSEVAKFILSGKDNANILAKAYFEPLGKSLSSNLSSGWFYGGTKLKPGSFAIFIGNTASFASKQDKSFDLTAIGISSNVNITHGYGNISPTALGNNTVGPALIVTTKIPNTDLATDLAYFHTPDGLGVPLIPLPTAQLHVGIIKETEVVIRFLPKVNFSSDGTDYATYMWGIGIMHHVSQWILNSNILPFDITAGIAYARQKAQGNLKYIPSWDRTGGQEIVRTPQQKDPSFYNNQQVRIHAESFVVKLLLSKDIPSFTFFSGLQYSIGKTYIDTPGIYPQVDIRASSQEPFYEFFFNDIENPIGVTFNTPQPGLTAGVQYKLGKFSLHAEGTYADYKNVSAGIGFNL